MSADDKRVREFAYQIWESEGQPEGQEERHWEMARKLAEAEALAPSKPAKGKAPAKPRAAAQLWSRPPRLTVMPSHRHRKSRGRRRSLLQSDTRPRTPPTWHAGPFCVGPASGLDDCSYRTSRVRHPDGAFTDPLPASTPPTLKTPTML
jgi:hypothetical protein